MAHPHKFNLQAYTLGPDSGRPTVTMVQARFVIDRLAAVGYHPVGFFANPVGGMGLPTLTEQQLLDSGADPKTQLFPLVFHLQETDLHGKELEEAQAQGGDPIFVSGHNWDVASYYQMLVTAPSPGTLREIFIGLTGQPGVGGGGDTSKGDAQFMQFLGNDPVVQARIAELLSAGNPG